MLFLYSNRWSSPTASTVCVRDMRPPTAGAELIAPCYQGEVQDVGVIISFGRPSSWAQYIRRGLMVGKQSGGKSGKSERGDLNHDTGGTNS